MGMTYFIREDLVVFAYDDQQIESGYPLEPMRLMTDQEVYDHLNPKPTEEELLFLAHAREGDWRGSELAIIARQLEAIEEDEADVTPEDLLSGTRKQWLSYRGRVSNWKEGAINFPGPESRPQRPV